MARQQAFTTDDLIDADIVILGVPYVAGPTWLEWKDAPKKVRIESLRYDGYVQEFNVDIFEHFKIVDYGDAEILPEVYENFSAENILKSLWNTEKKIRQIIDAGAIPIAIGGWSPCTTYGVIKPISDRTKGKIGVISLDTHADNDDIDRLTGDPRVPGSGSWQTKMYELPNYDPSKHVEIGHRGQPRSRVEKIIKMGIHYYPMWKVRQLGIEALCNELRYAYEGTEHVWLHFDVDVLGGDQFGGLTDPMGLAEYEALRIMFEVGKRGFDGVSFVAIPPSSPNVHRFITYAIKILLAGKIFSM
jgi:agmatinase